MKALAVFVVILVVAAVVLLACRPPAAVGTPAEPTTESLNDSVLTAPTPLTLPEPLTAIATNAKMCWTCGGTPNPANFGGLCDPCKAAHSQRLHRTAKVLADHGQSNTELGRALNYLGY